VLIISDGSSLAEAVEEALRTTNVELKVVVEEEPWSKEALSRLAEEIASMLRARRP